ncbi:hypothetical protein [Deinococcus sp.]|uniref:hypothetical protein n=1 Tax=Deinococcus sp. TaxID=47478 RepID=UPI003CC6AAAC
MTRLVKLWRQWWQMLNRRPPPHNDDLVGVTAPHGPRPLSGGAYAQPDPTKIRR